MATKRKHAAAKALGQRGKGKAKTMSPAALQQRRAASLSALAKRRAQDDTTFQLPPGPTGADDDHYNNAE